MKRHAKHLEFRLLGDHAKSGWTLRWKCCTAHGDVVRDVMFRTYVPAVRRTITTLQEART